MKKTRKQVRAEQLEQKMLDQSAESLADSAIKMAIATKTHPYTQLESIMRLATSFDLDDIKGMTERVKAVIKSKEAELPFIL